MGVRLGEAHFGDTIRRVASHGHEQAASRRSGSTYYVTWWWVGWIWDGGGVKKDRSVTSQLLLARMQNEMKKKIAQ